MYDALDRVPLNDDTIFAQLFLHQDDLFRSLHDKISSGVKRTFSHLRQLSFTASSQYTLATSQHDRQSPNIDIPLDYSLAPSILNCDHDWCAICDVSQTTFVGSKLLIDSPHFISVRESDVDIDVLEKETRVDIRGDFIVRFDDVFYVNIDEVVERVDMLLDKTFDLQKCRQKEPFVLLRS